MNDKTTVKAQPDHVTQWAQLKRVYVTKRGSDAGRNRKAIPRTTNADIKQLADYWHGEYLQEMIGRPKALDKDRASRKRWVEAKRTIDRQLAHADPNAVYAVNEWFWQDATSRLAIYLESRKALPSKASLLIESVSETVQEGVDGAVNAAKDAVSTVVDQAGKSMWPILKIGGLVIGGIAGAAIVIPAIIRAFKDE